MTGEKMLKNFISTGFLRKYLSIMLIFIFVILLMTVLSSPILPWEVDLVYYYFLDVLILVILIVLIFLFTKKIYLPLKKLENKIEEFEQFGGIKTQTLFTEPKTMLEQIDQLLEIQKEVIEKEHARAIMTQKMKYAELQNQINPHFLYNTLENIRGQAIIDDNNTIAEMTEALSRFFRYNISKDNDIVKLSQELDNIKNYIQIQQYRFKDRFTFHIHNHDDSDLIYRCTIPKMTLQPIVENAIFHGLENKVEKGHIDLHIEVSENRITILVADDGVGMSAEALYNLNMKLNESGKFEWIEEKENSNGIAMENVNNRIRLLYGKDYGIIVSSTPGVGTEVEITLPLVVDG